MEEQEALRLRSLAESKYKDSNFNSALKYAKRAHRLKPDLDGVASMVTAFSILRHKNKENWYKILQVEPFAHINTIRTSYKKLALILHPDKNPHLGSDEAFKLVADAFRFLSDRLRRKEFDSRLRIKIQNKEIRKSRGGGEGLEETFWTACSTCRLLHKFERRYLGYMLVCPSCKKSFEAVEVESGGDGEGSGVRVRVRVSERLRSKGLGSENAKEHEEEKEEEEKESEKLSGGGRAARKRTSSVGEVMERSKKAKLDDKMMTLAEMQLQLKRKKLKEKEKDKYLKKGKNVEDERRHTVLKKTKGLGSAKSRKSKGSESEDLESMEMDDDLHFHKFNRDRTGRSFKKGQVWAMFNEDDGMPRNYGLVDEVVSVNPFKVRISWLELQNNGDQWLASWEKMGLRVPCGRFKVAGDTTANSVHIFSHLVDCDRVTRERYRIYPTKGSVWALYNEAAFNADGRNLLVKDKLCYDVVVFLTSYSEMYGLSMGYLEKVDGFDTVFKRRAIGAHAIRCLEKDEVRLISHEIPAKKFSGNEAPHLSEDCWELDPASLPMDLLTFG